MTSSEERQPPDRTPRRPRGRKLDEVFGEVLPDTTSDERDPWQDTGDRESTDAWYHENRPPHHSG